LGRYGPNRLREEFRFQNRPLGKFSLLAEAPPNPLLIWPSISQNDVVRVMPPQNSKAHKKRVSETPAPTDSSKKQKKANDAAPSTPKKAGPVLDLGIKLPKAQDYVNSYALSLFEEVKVPLLESLLIARALKTSASRLSSFGHPTLRTNAVNQLKVVKRFWILWHLK
jgi:hypothetical protein